MCSNFTNLASLTKIPVKLVVVGINNAKIPVTSASKRKAGRISRLYFNAKYLSMTVNYHNDDNNNNNNI